MGMDQTVTFAGDAAPSWPAVRDLLQRHGFPVHVRMIDGQLAFPDEEPPDLWQELRIGTPQGMVTLRRDDHGVTFVTWGNADAALRQVWNGLAWAFAEAGGGLVQTAQGPARAADFRRMAELPEPLRPKSE
jgi:hypothetical protein